MHRWKYRIGILLVFVVGVAIGAACTGWWFTGVFRDFHGPPDKVQSRMMDRLSHYLDLTDVQKTQVQPVVKDVLSQIQGIRNRVGPEIEKTLNSGMERMKPVLTPGQYTKLEARYQHILQRWHMKGGD